MPGGCRRLQSGRNRRSLFGGFDSRPPPHDVEPWIADRWWGSDRDSGPMGSESSLRGCHCVAAVASCGGGGCDAVTDRPGKTVNSAICHARHPDTVATVLCHLVMRSGVLEAGGR
jgi:hypothetical protein